MGNKALITRREAAELMGVSERVVDARAGASAVQGPVARNGRRMPMVAVGQLPVDAQRRFLERGKVVELVPLLSGADPSQMALDLTAPAGTHLSVEARAEAEKRYTVIEPLVSPDRYPMLATTHPTQALRIEYLSAQHQVPARTIYRWWSQWKDGGLPALVRSDRSDKGTSRVMNQAARELLLAMAAGHWTVAEMYRAYGEERDWRDAHIGRKLTDDFSSTKYARYIDEDGKLRETARLPEISIDTFRRWFERVPEIIRELARNGEDGFHSTQEPLSHRDYEAIQPMDIVVMDHRLLDIFCLAPDGDKWRLVRPWLTAAMDMRTRKWLAWAIVEQPSSDSIACVLRRLFVRHGVPNQLYWDNGKDFTCEYLEGKRVATRQVGKISGEVNPIWRGVLGTLDIRVIHAIPYRARSKNIEPNFGRISKYVDKNLAEWCGNKPGARPERLDEMVAQHERWTKGEADATPFRTIGEIAALYDAAIEDVNEKEMEGAAGMRKIAPMGKYVWMSPNEAWDAMIPRVARRTVPAEVLQMVFARRRQITVQHGEVAVTFDGRKFRYRFENAVQLAALNGKQVELAYDPMDLEHAAVYYASRFVGLASCVELRRMGEDGFVEDERDRRALLRSAKAFIKAACQLAPVAGPETRLSRRRAVAPVRESVPRVVVPVELPAALEAEVEARVDSGGFRFADAVAPAVESSTPSAAADEDDGEFRFL